MQAYDKIYAQKVHHNIRVKKTRWVILRYPTEGMSQLAGMSTEAFENYFFDVCCLDYRKMDKAMDALVDLMNKTDKVRIVAKGTDLNFSIKGVGAVKCSGHCNIPDGEVYTAPLRDSVNGTIAYNVPLHRERLQVRGRHAHLQGRQDRQGDRQQHRESQRHL